MSKVTVSEPMSIATARAESIPPTCASILLVDDQPARLLTYEAILSGMDLQCVRALSGAEALERMLKQDFAAILLDVDMPGMDGFEVARLIRAHPRLERTPIIFVTGVNVSELDRLKGYEVGAIDYIAVPVIADILRSKVAILVELYQRRSELKAVNEALASARQQLETEHASIIAKRDAQLQAVFEHPSQVIVVLRAERAANASPVDWTYLNANTNALTLLGYTREALLGRRLSEIIPALAPRVSGLCEQVLARQEVQSYEASFEERHYLTTMYPLDKDSVIAASLDITERKQMDLALLDADRRKDEFIAMLSHELRNPIGPVSNAAEILRRVIPQDHKGRPAVEIIRRQVTHLARLLDDLLDIGRITRDKIELRVERVLLLDCIKVATETAEPLIRERNHRLTCTETIGQLYVRADKVRLAQCIANLLLNAAKYTPPGGDIHLRLSTTADTATVEIEDNGIGISEEFLPRVFELFAQDGRSLDRSQSGLGIGLAVCKRVLEMHGGSITASSAGLEQGALFTIQLPVT